jgi:sulfur carrier protein
VSVAVTLNGRPAELPDGASVATAVRAAGAQAAERGLAVALDGEVVPRSEWEERTLGDGARVEVVRAVQGG